MIVFKDWGKHLRMGNFWYLLAEMEYISLKTGHEICLPEYFSWEYMNHPPKIDIGITPQHTFHFTQTNYTPEYQQNVLEYFNNRKNDVININLGSNCQSKLWWQDEEDYIMEKMSFKEEDIEGIKSNYSEVFNKKVIGIGVRRGDFVGHGCFYQIPISWYTDALQVEFPDWRECNILFFSDHIEECKTLFKGDNFYFAEPNGTHTHKENFKYYHSPKAIEQFLLGLSCDNMIIGSSTFSLWQALYVNYKGGKIVHSNRNLAGECLQKFYNPNFYPENWTKFEIK